MIDVDERILGEQLKTYFGAQSRAVETTTREWGEMSFVARDERRVVRTRAMVGAGLLGAAALTATAVVVSNHQWAAPRVQQPAGNRRNKKQYSFQRRLRHIKTLTQCFLICSVDLIYKWA